MDGQCWPVQGEVTFTYEMTQCADPWAQACGGGGDQLAACIEGFLEELGITVFSVRVEADPNGGDACQACDCGSGWILTVVTDEEGLARLQELLFGAMAINFGERPAPAPG